MDSKWYSKPTNRGSAFEQGLIIDETTGENIAVSYKSEHAPLLSAAPGFKRALQDIIDTPQGYLGKCRCGHCHAKNLIAQRALDDAKESR